MERKPDISEAPLELQSREEALVPPPGVLALGCSTVDTVDTVVSIRLAWKTLF